MPINSIVLFASWLVIIIECFEMVASLNLCPVICNNIACRNGVLSCTVTGLHQIPSILPPKTSKILLSNQDFSNAGDLSYQNISNYGPPQYNIKKITIDHSKLTGIAPETFSHLFDLSTLDFSYNSIKVIQPRTFESLNLNNLRLDGNHYLKLHCLSFNKVIIRHLSLINCSLTHLDFCTIKPIAGVLRSLILSHNQLQTISSKFEYIFQRLTQLKLNNNPFDCSHCKLNWLTATLQQRYQKFDVDKRVNVLDFIYPKCFTPSFLSGKFVHKIMVGTNNNLINSSCDNPSIKTIDLKFYSFNKLQVTCLPTNPQDFVIWIYKINNISVYHKEQKINLMLMKNRLIHNLSCLIGNFNGNASTNIKISWPDFYEVTDKSVDISTTVKTPTGAIGYVYSPQFSLIELLAAIFGSFALFLILFTIGIKYLLLKDSFCEKSKPLDLYYQPHFQQASHVNTNQCEQNSNLMSDFKPVSHEYYFESQDPYPNGQNTWEFLKYDAIKTNNQNNYKHKGTINNSPLGKNNSNQIYDTPKVTNSIFLDYKTHQRIPPS